MVASSVRRARAMRLALALGGAVVAALAVALVTGAGGPAAPGGPAAAGGPARSHASKPLLLASRAPRSQPALVPDPEASRSFPESSSTPAHAVAAAPSHAATTTTVAPGAPSDAQVRSELRQMQSAQRAPRVGNQFGGGSVDPGGNAQAPTGAPQAVSQVMAGGNAIATFPYRFGGGHASFQDNAYDCSGSVSYALAAAGMVSAPLTSGDLMSWGVPGPGRWITVLANPGHTFMYVAGLRFDTSGRDGPLGSRWQDLARSNAGFAVRHWPGL